MPVTPERIEEIQAAWRRYGTVRGVIRECGCSYDTAMKCKPADQDGPPEPPPTYPGAPAVLPVGMPQITYVPPQALAEMAAAAGEVAPFTQERDQFDEPVEQMWAREEQRGEWAIKKAKVAANFRFRAPGQHMLLAFVSDMHIAPGTVIDFKRMREDAELIRDTPNCWCVLCGDQVDNHIKHRAAVLSARSQPSDQYRLFEHYLSILGNKCLVIISGNHDNWTNQMAGFDALGRIARDNRVFYSPDEAWLDIEVGQQKYVVGMRHQYKYNSGFNQTHANKQWLRMGEREFDIGVIGHHHEHALEQFIYRGRFRWAARPGSYQITTAYSREYGFNQSIPTTPCFLLHGDEHDITGWKSVRAMSRSLGALSQLGIQRRAA